jgi:hypothetical protein
MAYSDPSLRFLTAEEWRELAEPIIEKLADRAGSDLVRRSAQIGPCVIDYVGEDRATADLFAAHWPPAVSGSTCDFFIYGLVGDGADPMPGAVRAADPERSEHAHATAVLAPSARRAWLPRRTSYDTLRAVCWFLVRHAALRAAASRKTPAWWPVEASCAEYQPVSGPARVIGLLGAPGEGKTVHAYGLARAKPANALVSDDLTIILPESAEARSAEARFWLSTELLRVYPHLVPLAATAASEGVVWEGEWQRERARWGSAAELRRAIAAGVYTESRCAELARVLIGPPGAHWLASPEEWLEPSGWVPSARLTDVILVRHETGSPWLVRRTAPAELAAAWVGARAGLMQPAPHGSPADEESLERRRLVDLAGSHGILTGVVNTLLPPAQTQFCLRHYAEGRSDCVRLVTDRSEASSLDSLAALGLGLRTGHATEGPPGPLFCLGDRAVSLVSFEKEGARVELVALDAGSDGFAQVKAAWPGKVDGFFARHAPLGVRDLFLETRHPAACGG